MDLSNLHAEASKLGVTSIKITAEITFDSGARSIVTSGEELAAFFAGKAAAAAEAPTHFHLVDNDSGHFFGAENQGLVAHRVQAVAYPADDAQRIIDSYGDDVDKLAIVGPVRDPMPDDIKNILDNNVEDFKNGYKAPRDYFEANIDEIPADVRTNSRKLREFWRGYWNYYPA